MMNEKRSAYQKQYQAQYSARTKCVNLTFSKDESLALCRAAQSQHKRPAAYIKALALAGMQGHAVLPVELQEELKTLRFAIHNIANNVNQMAHHSNTIHAMTLDDEHNLLQYLKQMDEVVQCYTEGRMLAIQDNGHDH